MDITDEVKAALRRIEGAVHARAALIERKLAAHRFYIAACAACLIAGAALGYWGR
ncbi:MAG TPA: hypothetical protein VFA50_15305 [Stellaceae bacterium]|nr:hypothetical protein [Stellaceae bacterium]